MLLISSGNEGMYYFDVAMQEIKNAIHMFMQESLLNGTKVEGNWWDDCLATFWFSLLGPVTVSKDAGFLIEININE